MQMPRLTKKGPEQVCIFLKTNRKEGGSNLKIEEVKGPQRSSCASED